jgi:predicted murein hydrolase (TIGR00659 family)
LNLLDFTYQPLFGIALSVICYSLALLIQQKWRWAHPLFLSAGTIIVFLMLTRIPYEAFQKGGDVLVFFLGPATVALGIPLYKNAQRIRSMLGSILGGVTIGAVSAMILSAILVWSLGGTMEMILTMMPKSITSPIALEISRQMGGIPELTAVLTVLTGLIGSMFGPALMRLCGIQDDISIGTAMGTASHGIGTARIIQDSELQGSVSGFAMGTAAIITSFLFMPVYWWLH